MCGRIHKARKMTSRVWRRRTISVHLQPHRKQRGLPLQRPRQGPAHPERSFPVRVFDRPLSRAQRPKKVRWVIRGWKWLMRRVGHLWKSKRPRRMHPLHLLWLVLNLTGCFFKLRKRLLPFNHQFDFEVDDAPQRYARDWKSGLSFSTMQLQVLIRTNFSMMSLLSH